MLKKNILILLLAALSGVSSVVAMDLHEDHSIITTSDSKEFRVPDRLLRLSETLKNLMQDADTVRDAIPLPNIKGSIWCNIQALLPLVKDMNTTEAKESIKKHILSEIMVYDGTTLIDFIVAVNYLDIPALLALAMDVAKETNISKITPEQFANLPVELRNPLLGDIARRFLGPQPLDELSVGKCNSKSWFNLDWINFEIRKGAPKITCVTADNHIIIISSDWEKTVTIFNVRGERVAQWHMPGVWSMCVTSDNKLVLSAGGKIYIYDMQGNELQSWQAHAGFPALCTKDSKIISGGLDNSIRVWDMEGNQLAQCDGHTGHVWSLCVTQDNRIVSGSWDKTVRVWDMQGKQLAVYDQGSKVWSVVVTPDDKMIASLSEGRRVWDLSTEQEVKNSNFAQGTPAYMTHDHNIVLCRLLHDGDTRYNVACIMDKKGKELAITNKIDHSMCAMCVTQDNHLVSADSNGNVHIWEKIDLFKEKINQEQAIKILKLLGDVNAMLQRGKQVDKHYYWRQIKNICNNTTNSLISKNTLLKVSAGAAAVIVGIWAYQWYARYSDN